VIENITKKQREVMKMTINQIEKKGYEYFVNLTSLRIYRRCKMKGQVDRYDIDWMEVSIIDEETFYKPKHFDKDEKEYDWYNPVMDQ
jgi:hypothetical protein